MDEHVFSFMTKFDQTILLGRSARNVPELLDHVRTVPRSSIYHHTHRFLQQHEYLAPEPSNDFAYWVSSVLGEDALGERLSGIDIIQAKSIEEFRASIVALLEEYLAGSPRRVDVPAGEEFYFMASKTFVLPTPFAAHTLADFKHAVALISVHSLYYHIFDAHVRHEGHENDFSVFCHELGEHALAESIARLDPYSHTLEGLRQRILTLVENHDQH
jgi:hypothetical protein